MRSIHLLRRGCSRVGVNESPLTLSATVWRSLIVLLVLLTNSNSVAIAKHHAEEPIAKVTKQIARAETVLCNTCRVSLEKQTLVIENDRFVRNYDWNGGQIIARSIRDKQRKRTWSLLGSEPDFLIPSSGAGVGEGRLDVSLVAATSVVPAYLAIQIEYQLDSLAVRRSCRLFAGVTALKCEFSFKGDVPKVLRSAFQVSTANAGERKMIESSHTEDTLPPGIVVDRWALPGQHWRVSAVAFEAATDYNDTLVNAVSAQTFRKDLALQGNLLTLKDSLSGDQFFILKESPSKADQLYYPGYDFRVRHESSRAFGLGLSAADIQPGRWVTGYAVVNGFAAPGELALFTEIRRYQEKIRSHKSTRDDMILMNTWGDRNRDGRVNERFISAELRAAAKLGMSHFQIDDGWQAGLSSNSASPSGTLWSDWSKESWQPHPQRFPNGFAPLVALADSLNIKLGIWFNPSSANDYINWQRDADVLLDLYRNHGINVFKIDGIEVSSKIADDNLRRFFDYVQTETQGSVVFNLDVTAGRRPGYHRMTEYGNIFLENRYTDWANYYPYRTLRNLWMLSRYMPAQGLQIEFLNKWRNSDKYTKGDPLAPTNIPFDYQFALTMFAQPLAWFEATGLPAEASSIAPIIKGYRDVQSDIHKGQILPIGEQPTGTSWTGFQSIVTPSQGWILVLREFNADETANLATWLPGKRQVKFDIVLGSGTSFSGRSARDGEIEFTLPTSHSFALYRYQLD